jgi:cell division protein FtsL
VNPLKIIKIPKKHLFIGVILVLLVCIVLSILLLLGRANCQEVSNRSQSQLHNHQFNAAYTTLKKYENSCGYRSSRKDDVRIQYEFFFAIAAYKTGHLSEAQNHAKNGLTLNTKTTSETRSKIPKQPDLISDLWDISQGHSYINFWGL